MSKQWWRAPAPATWKNGVFWGYVWGLMSAVIVMIILISGRPSF